MERDVKIDELRRRVAARETAITATPVSRLIAKPRHEHGGWRKTVRTALSRVDAEHERSRLGAARESPAVCDARGAF